MLNSHINEVFSNRATSLIRPLTVGPEGGRINKVSPYQLNLNQICSYHFSVLIMIY